MAGNDFAWKLAVNALGWSYAIDGKRICAGWPKLFSIADITRLQYPDNQKVQRALADALLIDIDAGIFQAVKKEFLSPSSFRGRDDVFVSHATQFIEWLAANGETPSAHINAWLVATNEPPKQHLDFGKVVAKDYQEHELWGSLKKELWDSLKPDASFASMLQNDMQEIVDGFLSPEHNTKIPVTHFRQEMERKLKEKQRRDEELKNLQVQAHLEALRQFEAEKQQAKKQPETLPDAGAMSVNNDCDFSGFLKIPSRIDDWFCVIDDMVKIFYSQHGKPPNETQAWGQLWTTPPAGYSITASTERGEDCLKMPGVSPLSKSAFSKRWKKYADNSL